MPTSVGPDGIDVTGYGWTNQSAVFNSNLSLESHSGPTSSASTPALTSGTAAVVNSSYDTMLYANVTTTSTVAIAIGSTSAATTTVFASGSVVAPSLLSVLVPAGWYVKATFTSGEVTFTAVTTKL